MQKVEREKILLIKHRDFSYIDLGVYQQLIKWFPEYEIELYNVYDIYKAISTFKLIINLVYFIREYGLDYLLGYKGIRSFRTYFKSTSYFVSIYQKHVNAHIQSNKYYFVFQLQSLFNGATKGTPHFVYSDHITIANFHYPDVHPRQYARSKAFIQIEQALYQSALGCFTMSSNISDLIIKEYHVPESRVKCVYAGSNLSLEPSANDSKYSGKNILFVGIDWKRKGGPILLKVFEQVLKEVPDAQLTIIGCSPKVPKISNIKVMGKLPLDQLSQYFKNASVFCLPTLREPFGLVFIEAMSYKLPIVSNNIGALPDMVKNGTNGFLVNNNIEEYTKVLVDLLKSPEMCKKMGENGYDIVKNRYTWDEVGKSLCENITQLLKEK